MAVEPNHPGDFILEVAASGRAVAATLEYFTSQTSRVVELEALFVDVSISSSLLTDMGTIVKKYENDFNIHDNITRPICESCATDFEKLHTALKDAVDTEMWKSVKEINTWFIFAGVLGGRNAAGDLCRRIEKRRHSLFQLADTVKYKICRKLNEQNRFDPIESSELRKLELKLPPIARNLLGQVIEQQISIEVKQAPRLKRVPMRLPGNPCYNLETSSQSTLTDLPVGGKNSLFGSKLSGGSQAGSLLGDDFYTSPDARDLFGDNSHDGPPIKILSSNHPTSTNEKNLLDEDQLAPPRNIRYENDLNSISLLSSFSPNKFLEKIQIYEEWAMKWISPKRTRTTSWSLIGLKITEVEEIPGYWSLEPQFRSQTELRKKHASAISGTSISRYEANIEEITRGLPSEAHLSLTSLIKDREEASCSGFRRHWYVAAIEPLLKQSSPFALRSKCTGWLVMIRGETVDEFAGSRPVRHGDPWKKSVSRED